LSVGALKALTATSKHTSARNTIEFMISSCVMICYVCMRTSRSIYLQRLGFRKTIQKDPRRSEAESTCHRCKCGMYRRYVRMFVPYEHFSASVLLGPWWPCPEGLA
jgi:hypothetical protein